MEYTIVRIVALIIITSIFVFRISSQHDEENGVRNEPNTDQKYRPYFYSLFLPGAMIGFFVVDLCFFGLQQASRDLLSACFSAFLSIGFYYVILLCILPLLRKQIAARSCAFLWLVPNYLYIVILHIPEIDKPLFVLHAPGILIWWLLGIWLIGFISVIAWNVLSHLRYRNFVLQGAVPITNPDIVELWQKEISDTHIDKVPENVYISPNASTPMTIGIFHKSMRVLLPAKSYSLEDLSLIFRHELVHIGRQDSHSKFFLMFCTALCWFNPFVWIATKKCAEDLELSCDETVLIFADDEKKRRYAQLILQTAGNECGFTTCLSVKAKSLHYRLNNIMHASMRTSGIFLIGLISFLLMFTCGHIALAYGDTSGKEIIFRNEDIDNFKLTKNVLCTDEAELLQYLETLTISEITGDYFFSDQIYKLNLSLESSTDTISLGFSDEVLAMSVYKTLGEPGYKTYTYYLPYGIDWDTINSYFE